MGRPLKHNADFFSHDADMRNDVKIKAVRHKFGPTGYAVWCFLIETLTNADYFEIPYNDVEMELLSADFDVELDKLREIVDYCLRLKLLEKSHDGSMIYSKTLKNRFDMVLRRKNKPQVSANVNESYCNKNSTKTLQKLEKTELMLQKPDNNSDKTEFSQQKPPSNGVIAEFPIKKDSIVYETKVSNIRAINSPMSSTDADDANIAISKSDKSKEKEKAREVMNYYNEQIAKNKANLVSCTAFTDKRKQAILGRLNEYGEEAVKCMIDKAVASRFLNYDATNAPVNIDWIFKPNNFPKVLEGNYDNRQRGQPNGDYGRVQIDNSKDKFNGWENGWKK